MATKRKPPKRRPTPKPKPRKRVKRRSNAPPPAPHIKRDPVDPAEVQLVEGKGSPEHGGGPGGHYWHIHVGGRRAGHVFINWINEEPYGDHASVQIFLNESEQGKQIGRVAYRLACERSRYDTVYAHMRKGNTASKRAAQEAGFKAINDGRTQLTMVWHRPGTEKP
ncbi:MAG: GNAT family N-acetyltransferase [Acidobacteriota bacterium]|nr:GNAT family N-acetyltransferase [Acidobacteriota bacterium]